MKDKVIEIEECLVNRVGSYVFGPKVAAALVDKSISTLFRWRKNAIKIEFRKTGKSKNSPIEYTARAIAEYIMKKGVKVMEND